MANSKACKSLKRPPVVSRALCSRLVDFAFSLNLVTSARSVTDVFWVTVSRDGVESGCRRGVDRPSLAIFYRPPLSLRSSREHSKSRGGFEIGTRISDKGAKVAAAHIGYSISVGDLQRGE